MASYIKELLDLPAQVNKGDFVLNLAAGVTEANAGATLANYVVTPQLAGCFDQALGIIKGALEANSSKACYLHGSFGSGKSHFMAVLHLLLHNNPGARGITELAAVVAKHNIWTEGKKFLLVPFHMIGSKSMEQGIFGQYASYVRQIHPEAAVPGVYLAESLFEDALALKGNMGDGAFFEKLNEKKDAGGGWGDVGRGWAAESFAAAMAAAPGNSERGRLVGDLIGTYFRSYHHVAAGQEEAYLDLDRGLAVMAQHAQGLGYDAVILFLDELILWLASHAADLGFIHRETQKLVKLVEAQDADRPIPLISFVARQRDLRKLIGDTVPGAQKINFDDSMDWSEGRFAVIKLEDRNLPLIANKRILKPRNAAAAVELEAAFEKTAGVRREVMDVLLANEYDRETFRLIYPFSPALMETLIAASGMLQRERTALKVMLQILVEQQETLRVGDIVPVGDLYDAIAHGEEAFSQDMKIHFDNARKLYDEKLLPMLEAKHLARREELLARPMGEAGRMNFMVDDRLIKTLLLAALLPGVQALRGLNAGRLAALNHGTIRVPIAGTEPTAVMRKIAEWSSQVGEIKVEREGNNPTISIQLSGVDTEAIIAAASGVDNEGNQRRMVRQALFAELELEDADQMFLSYGYKWRNTERQCDVIYGNVRELPDPSLTANGTDWKIIIDYPFDEPGRTTKDDISRLQKFSGDHPGGTRTIVWLPAFFSEAARRDLSRLVIIDHILTGERFNGLAAFLSPQDRQTAKTLLDNQRTSLRERVRQHIQAAYGIRGSVSNSVDDSHLISDTFHTLHTGLNLQPPGAGNLKEALVELLGQALGHEFSGHPMFGAEVKAANLRKVYEETLKAVAEKDGRLLVVDRTVRGLMKEIAEPLGLGQQSETHFVLGQRWKDQFTRKMARSGAVITVERLRQWMDEPAPMGLPRECANLVILIFAAQTNRSFFLHGASFEATLANLSDDCELREQRLVSATVWDAALKTAAEIFGTVSSPLLNAANMAKLAEEIQLHARAQGGSCRQLVVELGLRLTEYGCPAEEAARHQTAVAVMKLLEMVQDAKPAAVLEALAGLKPRTSAAAMGTSLKTAGGVVAAMGKTEWKLLASLVRLTDERQAEVRGVVARVTEALKNDQHVTALEPVLRSEQSRAVELLTKPVAENKASLSGPGEGKAVQMVIGAMQGRAARKMVDSGMRENISVGEAREELARLEKMGGPGQATRVTVSWIIEE